MNQRLVGLADDPAASLRIDSDWHALLVSTSGNERLMAVTRSLRLNVMRYECAFMRERARVAQSVSDHKHLITLLRQGDMALAAAGLKEHWERSLAAIVESAQ